MDVMLERDDNVVIYGQDVGYFGGVFRCTEGLQAKYGRSRVFDAPISEGGIVGSAIGMGAYGLRPVVEVQFADYFYPAYDQIVSEAARLRYRSAGDFTAPITIRMPCGGGIYGGQTHSQSPEAAVHPRVRRAHGDAIEPARRQGPADRLDRERRPGDLPGTQAPVQRPVRRPPRPAAGALVGSIRWARCPRATTRCRSESAAVFRPGTRRSPCITYGTMVFVSRGGGARDRHRRRDHRPAQPLAAGPATRSSSR